nr:uncharacterized protein LOC109167502 [Ipomoea batatas]
MRRCVQTALGISDEIRGHPTRLRRPSAERPIEHRDSTRLMPSWSCASASPVFPLRAARWLLCPCSFTNHNVLLESDCLQVINGINEDHEPISSFDLLIYDIKNLARDFSNLSFLFVKRSANGVAHVLAREALSKSDCIDCSSVPFPSIAHALSLDR